MRHTFLMNVGVALITIDWVTNGAALAAGATPIGLTTASYNQDMVVELGAAGNLANSVSATMDGGAMKTGFTWYEKGFNASSPTTGLPKSTVIFSESDPTTGFVLMPYFVNNVRMFDVLNSTGTLTLQMPSKYSALSFLAASGHGPGMLFITLHFADGSANADGLSVIAPDWFGGSPVAITANGRVDTAGTFDAVGTGNPRLYQLDLPLPASAADHPLASIDINWNGTQTDGVTALFAVSGTPVPEPGSLMLMGLTGLALLARRRGASVRR
jgi:hypothetical protein